MYNYFRIPNQLTISPAAKVSAAPQRWRDLPSPRAVLSLPLCRCSWLSRFPARGHQIEESLAETELPSASCSIIGDDGVAADSDVLHSHHPRRPVPHHVRYDHNGRYTLCCDTHSLYTSIYISLHLHNSIPRGWLSYPFYTHLIKLVPSLTIK